jgi:hypothetical protein
MSVNPFTSDQTCTRNAAFGVYEIRATLPTEDGEFRYRIKSQIELHERVVKESELSKA